MQKPKLTTEEHYAYFYRNSCTEAYRMELIWFLEERDMALALKVRELVGATFAKNPLL